MSKVENFLTQEEEQAVVEAIRKAELKLSGDSRAYRKKKLLWKHLTVRKKFFMN